MTTEIKTGDTIEFFTCCNADRKKYVGVVEHKDQLGLITIADGVQYEVRKLVDIKKKGIRNTSWSMRQSCGEAVQGFVAFLKDEKFEDNPHNTAVKYKNWAAGWKNGEDATPDQIEMFKWIYSI